MACRRNQPGECKGADTGIDGYIYFKFLNKEENKYKDGESIIQVKGGKVGVRDIRELAQVVKREEAQIGIFISLNEPTRNMKEEAVREGFFREGCRKIQIITIEELLDDKKPNLPYL